jgi:hypothetical protein
MRLQVIEGAAGVPIDSWMRLQRRGLAVAKAHFEGQYPIDPLWFSTENTGVYNVLFSCIQRVISSYKLRRIEPLDVMNSQLMGLGSNMDVGRSRPCYAAGVATSARILAGKEHPAELAKGKLCQMFMNKVSIEERKQRDVNLSVNEEGAYIDIPEAHSEGDPLAKDSDPISFADLLAEVIFKSSRDSVGIAVRDLMRATWHDSPPMLLWLKIVEDERRYPSLKEVADKVGMAPAAFRTRHWIPRWIKFQKAVKSNHALLQRIQDKASDWGLYWDTSEIETAEIESVLHPRAHKPQ